MTDPHDRPYTFGWHGEIIRREDAQRAAAARAEHVRAIAERAFREGMRATHAALGGPWIWFAPDNPYERDEADQ